MSNGSKVEFGDAASPIYFHDIGDAVTREETPEGFLAVRARFARTGIQTYQAQELREGGADVPDELNGKAIRILRPAAEVLADGCLESFRKKPITDNHPPEFVRADNYRKYQVGLSGDQVEGDPKTGSLFVDLLIQDPEMIQKVERGKDQVSAGYGASLDWTAGTDPEFGAYDGIQKGIRGNHIAIVDRARGGPGVRILDAEDKTKGETMVKRTIKGKVFEFVDASAEAVDEILAEMDGLNAKMDGLKSKIADLTSEKEEAEGEAADAKEKAADAEKAAETARGEADAAKSAEVSDAKIAELADQRIAVIDAARKLDPKVEIKDSDGKPMTLDGIRRAALGTAAKDLDLADRSPEYVEAAFDTLVKSGESRGNPGYNRINDGEDGLGPAAKARAEFIERGQNAWKAKKGE